MADDVFATDFVAEAEVELNDFLREKTINVDSDAIEHHGLKQCYGK